jgi:hypothetical protein
MTTPTESMRLYYLLIVTATSMQRGRQQAPPPRPTYQPPQQYQQQPPQPYQQYQQPPQQRRTGGYEDPPIPTPPKQTKITIEQAIGLLCCRIGKLEELANESSGPAGASVGASAGVGTNTGFSAMDEARLSDLEAQILALSSAVATQPTTVPSSSTVDTKVIDALKASVFKLNGAIAALNKDMGTVKKTVADLQETAERHENQLTMMLSEEPLEALLGQGFNGTEEAAEEEEEAATEVKGTDQISMQVEE